MKSDEIGMPLPRNHAKSVEYRMPLELYLDLCAVKQKYMRHYLVKSRNSKFLISFGVSVLTVLMWPYYDDHTIYPATLLDEHASDTSVLRVSFCPRK